MTPTQQAYALLWRSTTDDPLTHRARAILREAITREQQWEAIQWVRKEYGDTSTEEILAAALRNG